MVHGHAASPAADCSTLTCGVIAIALTYHFSRGDSIEKFYFCTSVLHMFATRMGINTKVILLYSVTCAKSVLILSVFELNRKSRVRSYTNSNTLKIKTLLAQVTLYNNITFVLIQCQL